MSNNPFSNKHLLNLTVKHQSLEASAFNSLDQVLLQDNTADKLFLTDTISNKDILTGIYCSVLASIFLGQHFRKKTRPKDQFSFSYQKLKDHHLELCQKRFDESSGLLFLISPEESLLPKASYWGSAKNQTIAEPAFLSLMICGLEQLLFIGGQLNEDVSQLSDYLEVLTYSMNEQLWDDEYGIYFPKNISTDKIILSDSIGGLFPLLADIPDQEQAEALYRTLANNFVQGQHFYFPTESVLDGHETRMVDPLVNYLLFLGLTRYEFNTTAQALRQHTRHLVDHYGPQRSYDSKRNLSKINTESSPNPVIDRLLEDFFQADLIHYSNAPG
ncbi:MAG: hypothetical protein Sapg2KO_10900 [Saprospiraceae bacterium]